MENTINTSIFDEQPLVQYADNGKRFVNYLIDLAAYYLLYLMFAFITGALLAIAGHSAEEIREMFSNRLLPACMSLGAYFLYYFMVEGITKGRTLGKLITKTVAVNEDLSAITWKQAFMRTICRMIPFEPLSGFGNQFWHDRLSKTHVILKQQQL